MSMPGGTEWLLILIVLFGISFLVTRFIYRYGKNKGRLEELEKRVKDNDNKPK